MSNDTPQIDPIPLASPDIRRTDIEAVEQTLRSGVLSRGPQGTRLADRVAEISGRRHGVPLSSGTAGLHTALVALGIGRGDEVITTAFSVPATLNPILAVGATPILVDIETESLGMDPTAVAEAITPNTRAIIAVHAFGVPARIEAIASLARERGIELIEDSCEALGTQLTNASLGSFGAASVFGFYPNKQITTGEGGVLVTDDESLADAVRLLANHGRRMDGQWLDQHCIGFNYRLSELQASLGNAQLDRLPEIVQTRAELAARYTTRLADSAYELPRTPESSKVISWFAWVIRLPAGSSRKHRDALVESAAEMGIQLGRYFAPLHLQPAVRLALNTHPGQFPITEDVACRSVALPLFMGLSEAQIERVCDCLLGWQNHAGPV
jgi:perosamine synthetase